MRKNNNSKKKSTYKGPFPNNPNLLFQNVKKSMRTEIDGPTVDTFSTMDTTTNTGLNEVIPSKQVDPNEKRPTKEKQKKFSFSAEWILGLVFVIASTIVGIVIYNHSNRFVSVEKDIDYIKINADEQKKQIEKVSEQTTSIDKKVDLLNQKVDFKFDKK